MLLEKTRAGTIARTQELEKVQAEIRRVAKERKNLAEENWKVNFTYPKTFAAILSFSAAISLIAVITAK